MMDQPVTPGRLRSFGLIVGVGFSIIGLWPLLLRQETPRLWALSVAGLLVVGGLLLPRSLGLLYRGWMALGHVLGWFNTRVILGLMFFLVFTPMGLVKRLFGSDPMNRRLSPDQDSYRIPKDPRDGSHMKRQF